MNNGAIYSIGEFSKKTNTPIRTLHYYDEIGLLKVEKDRQSGHRLYTESDILKLQKIVAFKFLGYSLEEIGSMMKQDRFDLSLSETLLFQKQAFEEKKEQMETVLTALNRTITLLKEMGEVDSEILMMLISNIQTEKEQREWMEKVTSKQIVEQLFDKSEEEKLKLDKEFIELSKEIKRLKGRPSDDPEVQELVNKHMQATIEFVGEEAMQAMSELDETDMESFEQIVPSPYTKEEDEWLQQAMEYYMIQTGMYSPEEE